MLVERTGEIQGSSSGPAAHRPIFHRRSPSEKHLALLLKTSSPANRAVKITVLPVNSVLEQRHFDPSATNAEPKGLAHFAPSSNSAAKMSRF
jgi:hypothetical protein